MIVKAIKVNYKISIICVFIIGMLCMGFALSAKQRTQASANLTGKISLPIVMYHELMLDKTDKMVIAPWEFENDLKYLKNNNYNTIDMTQLIDYVYYNTPLPLNPIILTFDDGYLNNYKYALPLLEKYHMRAVLSLIGKDTDDFTNVKSDNLDYSHVTWEQAIDLQKSGCFEIQNHTYNLHSTNSSRYGCSKNSGESLEQYEKVLTDDLIKCQQVITKNTGFVPNTFTYPYGSISKESLPIIKSLGFKASLSCKYGINLIGKDTNVLYCLRRISRYHNVSIKKTIHDAMDTLKFYKS
jgi:peptidoglycan/xylan/chitin deacetylase (PgdA/CDA1 family)